MSLCQIRGYTTYCIGETKVDFADITCQKPNISRVAIHWENP